jgi:predicted dehydrogenase
VDTPHFTLDATIKIALVGAGLFGGDVHARTYGDLQRSGIGGQLGRVGLDAWTRDLASVKFQLVGIAARSEPSVRRAQAEFRNRTGHEPKAYWGEQPWLQILKDTRDLDVLAVATPDHLHTDVILAGLRAGSHIITEKPMCLDVHEADQIVDLSRSSDRIVAVDMHKRYDPDHLRICHELKLKIGEPLYGVAYLEEPIELPTGRFKWAEHSDPFTYVGPHWVDLIGHYFQSKPVSLVAIGQKKRLVREGINAYDAVQVRVDFANGLSMHFHNHWVTPPDFEGPVNQGHELVGTEGKIESDQQYRGLRWWATGQGSRTANTHFTRNVERPEGPQAYIGYGVDSLTVALAAICRMKFFGARRASLEGIYPNAQQARVVVAIIQAARVVRDLNFKYLQAGLGAPVSARFDSQGICILDPNRAHEGPEAVVQRIYDRPL